MASSRMQSGGASLGKSKRTNSLAFAQTDCHTCASLDERCDRRRPQCSACLDRGRKCGGFATPLSWDPKRMWSDGSFNTAGDASNNRARRDNTATDPAIAGSLTPTCGRSNLPRAFRFVKGASRPRKRRRVLPRAGKDTVENQSEVQEAQSPALSNAVPRVSSENSNLMDHDQVGNCQREVGMTSFLFSTYLILFSLLLFLLR